MKRNLTLLPYLPPDILQHIVGFIPLLLRLPLRTLGSRMERAVNRSVRAVRFTKGGPVETLSQKFINLERVTVYTELDLYWICTHNHVSILEITVVRFCKLIDVRTVPLIEHLPNLIRFEADMYNTVASSFASPSIQHFHGYVGLSTVKDILEFIHRMPSLTRLDFMVHRSVQLDVAEYIATRPQHVQGMIWSTGVLTGTMLPDYTTVVDFGNVSSAEQIRQCVRRMPHLHTVHLRMENQLVGLWEATQLRELRTRCAEYPATLQRILHNNPSLEILETYFYPPTFEHLDFACFHNLKHLRVRITCWYIDPSTILHWTSMFVHNLPLVEKLGFTIFPPECQAKEFQSALILGLPRLRILYGGGSNPDIRQRALGRRHGVSVLRWDEVD